MAHPVPRVSRTPAIPLRHRMHGQDRRKQLLKVAVDVFARQGFGGTKTRDIAAAAGVSEAILFRHFASKEDLYHAILDAKEDQQRGGPDFLAALEEFAARRDDAGLIRHIASAIMQSFREDPAFHRLILFASLEGHLLAGLFHERFGLPVFAFLKRYVATRQKEGAFRKADPQIAVMFVMSSLVHVAMARHLFQFRRPNIAEDTLVREMTTLALGSLVSPRNAKQKTTMGKKKVKQA